MSYQRATNRLGPAQIQTNDTETSDLCRSCQELDQHQKKVVEELVHIVLELDPDQRMAFDEILGPQGYGTISMIFRAGNCVGLDWQSSHRTHET